MDIAKQTSVLAPEFGQRYSNYALGILLLVGCINIADRTVINVLLEPMAKDLQLSDWQLGLIIGPAFAVVYSLVQIPIARLADQFSRVLLIAIALALWSSMTALQSLAVGFVTLAVLRGAVAVGEAGSGPATQSMIADLFPSDQRARALSIYAFLLPVGFAAGSVIGGFGRDTLGWRSTLMLIGLPGVLLALVVWRTVRNPTRGYWEPHLQQHSGTTLLQSMRYLFGLRSFRYLIAAFSACVIALSAASFDAVYLERSLRFSGAEIGTLFGITGLLGIVGTYLGGWIADRVSLRDVAHPMRLASGLALLYSLTSAAYYLASSKSLIVALSILGIVTPGSLGIYYACGQRLAPPHMRARAAALLLTISTLMGIGLGPPAVGALSDAFAASFDRESLRYSQLCLIVGSWLACSVLTLLGSRSMAADIARVNNALP